MIRDFNLDDVDSAVRFAIEEWGHYSGFPEDIVNTLGNYGIRSYIRESTYARTFDVDGKAAGMLFGAIPGDERLFPDLERPSIDGMPKAFSDELTKEKEHNVKLLEECKDKGYDCKLVYFISDKDMRGKGVGSSLIKEYMDYCRSRGKRKMYLYTDDFSKYQFYERKGFTRDVCRPLFVDGADHEYYIYSKVL